MVHDPSSPSKFLVPDKSGTRMHDSYWYEILVQTWIGYRPKQRRPVTFLAHVKLGTF